MKKILIFLFFISAALSIFAQGTSDKLNKAMEKFLADPTLKHAITGFYVLNAGTGKVIYNLNGEAGLAPGSTQKIYTSIAAFDLLGKDYQFETALGYAGNIDKNTLNGNIIIRGSGDPSFGSSLFPKTIPTQIFSQFFNTLNQSDIKEINGNILVQAYSPAIPGAWIWEDLGNYYGAASSGLNWRENEYNLHFRSGEKIGEPVSLISINNDSAFPMEFDNEVTTAGIGSGDQSYIYLPFNSSKYLIRGTIPVDENDFIVYGAVKDPAAYFVYDLQKYLHGKINFTQQNSGNSINNNRDTSFQILYKYFSPSLDSLTYFFLQKSINLY
ncbi:MAG: D-alanyl-D-alanine carboxypeptidase/D-alanyl-D-alanine-endopeptidase, partial [Chitinophagaceae bacterium]